MRRSYYNQTNVCDRCKINKLTPGNAYIEYNEKGDMTGKWLCRNCHFREYQKTDPNSRDNTFKRIADFRNKQLDKNSNLGKGFIGEQIFCMTRDAINCNLKLDNFTSKIDVKDIEFGMVQVKSPALYLNYFWNATGIKGNFEILAILCMSNDYKHVERVYIIPKKDVGDRTAVGIVKNPTRGVWYEKFRVDEKPYDDVYHSMNIKNCTVLRD